VISGLSLPASSLRNDRPQPYVQWVKPAADTPSDGVTPSSQIAHVPIKVIGQGSWTPAKGTPAERYVVTESMALNSILLSGTVGFMQEKTNVRTAVGPVRQP
jgi:hypothetical protein